MPDKFRVTVLKGRWLWSWDAERIRSDHNPVIASRGDHGYGFAFTENQAWLRAQKWVTARQKTDEKYEQRIASRRSEVI